MWKKAQGTQILVGFAILKLSGNFFFEKTIEEPVILEWGLTKQLQFFSRVMRRSVDFRMQEKQLLDNILGPKIYDRRIRPGGSPGGSGGNLTSGKAKLFEEAKFFEIIIKIVCF